MIASFVPFLPSMYHASLHLIIPVCCSSTFKGFYRTLIVFIIVFSRFLYIPLILFPDTLYRII